MKEDSNSEYIEYRTEKGNPLIVAIDYDGTIVEDGHSNNPKAMPNAFEVIKRLAKNKHKLILFTCREGKTLEAAVKFCKDNGITFNAVNESIDKSLSYAKHKPVADIYIDDRAIMTKIDWKKFEHYFELHGAFSKEDKKVKLEVK
jgi:ribonucleotide monophosphatase NagD (HAD superfamily)